MHKGLIKYGNLIWVGENSSLRTKIIAALHASAIGGHSGTQATYQRIKRVFYWKGLKQDVHDFVQQCQVCQQAKHELLHPSGLLQPLPVPEGVWQDLTMDFVEGLPKSNGYDTILVVVDRFSKYAHFIAVKHPFTAQSIAKLFLDNIVRLHGMPKTIVSDRDRIFTSTFWKELFKLHKVQLAHSTAYHPQTDGQSERVNQCLEMYLRCAVNEFPRKWCSWLPMAEFWYNSSFHSALGCSPFKALYGCEPNFGAAPLVTKDTNISVAEMLKERADHQRMLKDHLLAAQNRMKLQADRKRTEREFQVGDQVLLKLQPYAQKSVVNRPFPKLAFKFFGPFKVIERIGAVAYKLELPADSDVHPVFHISQLKPFHPDFTPVFSNLPKVTDLSATDIQPEAVLQRRLVKKGNRAVPQVLIKWASLPETASTWEDYYVVQKRFPESSAWGQAHSQGGEDVRAEA